MSRLSFIIAVFFSCVFLSACEADVEVVDISKDITLSPDYIIPLGSASVMLGKVLTQNFEFKGVSESDGLEIYYVKTDSIDLPFYLTGTNNPLPITVHQNWNFADYLSTSTIRLADPKVDITLYSNLSSAIAYRIDSVKSYSSVNQSVLPAYGWFDNHTKKTFEGEFDSIPSSPGKWTIETLPTFDKNNGEIDKLISFDYNRTDYYFSCWTKTSPAFINTDPRIKVYVKTTIPLYFEAGSFLVYNDSINNIFTAISNAFDKYAGNKISQATLVLNVTNSLPSNTLLTMYFVDSLGHELMTGFQTEYRIESGKVDGNGIVQPGNETKQIITVSLDQQQLSELRKAHSIHYSVRVEGRNIQSGIHFTTRDMFGLKIGLFIKTNLKVT